jgi:hypothetical protein
MWHAVNDRRTVAHGIVSIEIRVIIGSAMVVVVAVGIRIVAPARIPGAHEDGGIKRAATVAVAVPIAGVVNTPGAVRCAHRGGRIGVIGA